MWLEHVGGTGDAGVVLLESRHGTILSGDSMLSGDGYAVVSSLNDASGASGASASTGPSFFMSRRGVYSVLVI